MSLSVGTRLGPYEVVSLIGVGGMGEVYRARDARLNRDVAIKVLPELFASDADRLARFGREAQLLASLNHPNIAAIYGLEDSSVAGAGLPGPREGAGSRPGHALVLELVPGPTLAERIAQGPIPLEDALPIARQIAEALEAAHEHGVVHRDLKPANVKVSDEGEVKVLDFGLAKALEGDASSIDVSHSPTLTIGATGQGVILGTAAYMAPEQARGKAVDRRADIWAFGCVLYEMLTGRRAFEGEVVSDTLAAILRGEPDWTGLPATTPLAIRRLLRRCLEKNRRERLQAIGDARIDITDALAGPEEGPPRVMVAPRSLMHRATPVAAVNTPNTSSDSGAAQFAVAERALVYATGGIAPDARTALTWVDRSGVVERLTLPDESYVTPRVAPDGRRVAVTIRRRTRDDRERVWIHELSSGRLTALLPASERGFWNIWNSDSQRLVFADGTLRMLSKAANGTGAAELLHTTRRYLAPSSWSNDGRTLAFVESHDATGNDIVMLDLTGATPRARPFLQTPAAEQFPEFSPDGRWIAYSSNHSGRPEVYVQPYPGPGPPVQVSIEGGEAPAWRADGAELFFLALASPDSPAVVSVMAANIERQGEAFVAGAPRKLFEGRYSVTGPVRGYDVTPDGRRFLMVQQLDPAPEPPSELVLVENWTEELTRRAPTTNSGR